MPKNGNSLTHIVHVYYPEPITIFERAEILPTIRDSNIGKLNLTSIGSTSVYYTQLYCDEIFYISGGSVSAIALNGQMLFTSTDASVYAKAGC